MSFYHFYWVKHGRMVVLNTKCIRFGLSDLRFQKVSMGHFPSHFPVNKYWNSFVFPCIYQIKFDIFFAIDNIFKIQFFDIDNLKDADVSSFFLVSYVVKSQPCLVDGSQVPRHSSQSGNLTTLLDGWFICLPVFKDLRVMRLFHNMLFNKRHRHHCK